MKRQCGAVKPWFILLLSVILALPLVSCSSKRDTASSQVFAMDTVMLLTAYGNRAEQALEAAKDVILRLDGKFDPESAESELNALNRSAGNEFTVSEELAELIRTSREIYENSGGAFDPSIYPIVKEWGFTGGRETHLPKAKDIDTLLSAVDFSRLDSSGATTSSDDMTVALPEDMELGFGGVAKGYAAAAAIEAIRDSGIQSAIISLGGNVQTLGLKPGGQKWAVGIRDPKGSADSYVGIVSVGETAVVSSGGYERFFEEDGKKYHHILDPKTGYPADNGLLSVTIVCRDGAMADALSTALFVLGVEAAFEYYDKYQGFEMILITEDNSILLTPGILESFEAASTDKYEYLVWRPQQSDENESGHFDNIM